MTPNTLKRNANVLVTYFGKPATEFTKADLIRYIKKEEIEMVNFLYPAGDGRLKTLNFVVNDLEYLDTILTCGERVDGSSLFSFIQAGSSDLYVVPRYRTAFVDPFAEIPTLCLLCSYFDKDGKPLESAPEQTLAKAARAFEQTTGMTFEAMGELEFYVVRPDETAYPAVDQRAYHESAPFAKSNSFRALCMHYIAQAGGQVKYGHSEVGCFHQDGKLYEQHEVEFLPVPVCDAADQLVVAKYIIRNLAYQEGLDVTFAPKITTGKAGSGLHIHMRLMKEGRNMMLADGVLSPDARKMIAGLMDLAPSLTAFGNKNPTAYLRLVPHQEAPTNVCWGDRNRSVLVRVPLGWTADAEMWALANPNEPRPERKVDTSMKQTVEIRSCDGSADVYQLLAGVCVAARHGFELPNGLEIAEQTYVDVNIHAKENEAVISKLSQLPDSCVASAQRLADQRGVYEQHGVFSPAMIDGIMKQLSDFADLNLREELQANPAELQALVDRFFHCG